MKTIFARRVSLSLLGASALAGTFWAGMAYAADARFDQAKDSIDRAIALLQAAENPDEHREFGGHRRRAIRNLEQAKRDIERAKAYQDRPRKPPRGGGGSPAPGGSSSP
jgi:hypothetical protein